MLTTDFVPGSPVWLDLGSPEPDAARSFYCALFGWTFDSLGPEAGNHGLFRLGDRTVGGLGPPTEEGAAPAWTVHFATGDIDATTDRARQAGGSVRFGPVDVFTHGRTSGLTDPTGARFAARQPLGTSGLGAVTVPGALCWTELLSTDPAAAKRFYRSVFGWQEQDVPFGDTTYTVVTPDGGGTDSGQGGIIQLLADQAATGLGSQWLPYFEVPDTDAAIAGAQRLGATVRAPAEEAHGVGRFAQLTDPHGAAFAVITTAAPGD
ncbi:VOC family protein [Kitasatospora sp. GP82]|uniref:VOC family protein n=1 Tax=Kitasatospora sp. GP82 TaxID=3035089 RepID=UPI002476D5B1|nr:VOC family protein [Kitasatospora sp. GP82]MDH6127802.1 putative enzyme related to lactoylglutathione lyase [Kitasatospora sp. GP82]